MASKMAVLLLYTIISVTLSAVSPADESDQTKSLWSFLKHFDQNRHHVTNPKGKQRARDFIQKTFQDLGLTTWSEKFLPAYPKNATGVNIIGMLPGTLAGTPNDRLFLIGSHYDTVRRSRGTDDNGSGVVAVLQVAKQIANKFKKCSRSFSILFLAFDFEEREDCKNARQYTSCACQKIGCGSRAFVKNLTRFYSGSLKGAIIMDTVLNFNETPNSQRLPDSAEQVIPVIFNQTKLDKFRGNFLAVVGRKFDDRALLDVFGYHYRKTKSDLESKTKMYKVNLPFSGQPARLPRSFYNTAEDFLRSDHVSFWNSNPSFSAIFLTDTADFRGYMTHCYHKNCDSASKVTLKMIQFLQKTTDVILAVATDFTNQSCPSLDRKVAALQTDTSEGDWEEWEVGLLSFGMFSVGMLIPGGAYAGYLRWKKKDDNLVIADHLQSNTNPVAEKSV